MPQFLLGLAIFFGTHSLSIVASPLRDKLAAKNDLAWKALYGVLSLVGIVLIVRGYADIKPSATVLYNSPDWLRYVSAILLLPAFILFLAPYFPGRIKTAAKHPQLVAVKLWALAHLLVNGTTADLLLFTPFLLWAVADRISMKSRTQRTLPGAPKSGANDAILIVLGIVLYVVFVFWLHGALIGVQPFS